VEEMITDLFPTKLYEEKVSNYDTIQEDFATVEEGIEWQNLWNTHLISDANFVEDIIPDSFREELRRHTYTYTGRDDFKVSASWMSRLEPGNYSVAHQHGHADLSGVYYYKTTGKDGDLYFQTPNLAATTTVWSTQPNYVSLPPVQGKLLLFPGWLTHGIHTNVSRHTRISVSFNITFDRP